MTSINRLHRELVERVREGAAHAPVALRRAAFDNAGLEEPIRSLVDNVVNQSYRVTDDDVSAARAAGLTEDQIFEVVVCAAVGQASRNYRQAMEALAAAIGEAR